MKKMRKVFALLAGVAMALGFVSCNTNVSPVYYTVTYQSEYGSAPEAITVLSGTVLTEEELPVLSSEGYRFGGWFDGETKALAGTYTVKADVTLTAKWLEPIELKTCKTLNSLFMSLGGGPVSSDLNVEYSKNSGTIISSYNNTVTRFAKASVKPENPTHFLDKAEREVPVWYDESETTLYYYVEDGKFLALCTADDEYANDMFSKFIKLESIETSDFDTRNVTDFSGMFEYCLSLKELDVTGFDTSSARNFAGMFELCQALEKVDVSGFDTGNVISLYNMFAGCNSLKELDVSGFDTGNVIDLSYMFTGCNSLKELDVSNFDTSKVVSMRSMFEGCESLTSLDLSSFDTGSAKTMSDMFKYCESLTKLDLSNFDTSNVTDMYDMFFGCSSLPEIDLSSFDTSNVKKMTGMFRKCDVLSKIIVSDSFVTTSVKPSYGDDVFLLSPKLVGGKGTVFSEDNVGVSYAHIDGGESNPGYFTAKVSE